MITTHPLPGMARLQDRIREGFIGIREVLEPPSNFSAIVSMIEGGGPTHRGSLEDLVHDPWAELEAVQARAMFRLAGQLRVFESAVKSIDAKLAYRLHAVYAMEAPHETLWLAYGGCYPLVPLTKTAGKWNAEKQLGLAVRVAGEPFRHPERHDKWERHPPTASEQEVALARRVRREAESLALEAVEAYAQAESLYRIRRP